MNDFLKRYRRETLVCLALAAAVWGVFGQTVRFGFVNFDDGLYVYQSPVILRGLTPEGVVYAFTSRLADGWYPLTTLSLMLDTTLYGGRPGGFHFTNVALHTAAVLALFGALRALTGSFWRSALVAALFAVHPLRAESVAWVSARKDVLSGLFFFLTLWAYARYARGARYARMSNVECRMSNVERGGGQKSEVRSQTKNPPRRSGTPPQEGIGEAEVREQRAGGGKKIPSRGGVAAGRGGFPAVWWYAATILFFACGLMSKATVVTLPFLLLLLDFWPLGRVRAESRGQGAGNRGQGSGVRSQESEDRGQQSAIRNPQSAIENRKSVIGIWKLFVEKLPLFVPALLVAAATVQVEKVALAAPDSIPFLFRVGNAFRSYAIYVAQTVWPDRLVPMYPHPLKNLDAGEAVAGLAAVLAVSAAVFIFRRKQPALLTGWLWYLGMLVPVIGLVQVGIQAHADRYTYLPHVGLLILAVWGATDLLRIRTSQKQVLSAVVLAVCMVLAWKQTARWKDSLTLFSYSLQTGHDSVTARNNLGETLTEKGRPAEALEHFQAALRLRPGYAEAHNNLGAAFLKLGRIEEALRQCQEAVRLKPSYATGRNTLGVCLARTGNMDDAIVQFQEALRLNPDYPEARNNLAVALKKKKPRP